MPEMIRCYRPNHIDEIGDSLLISGPCPIVKSAYLCHKLKKVVNPYLSAYRNIISSDTDLKAGIVMDS